MNDSIYFDSVYVMQPSDIDKFADTLADGFSQYSLYLHLCGDTYNMKKMKLFWRTTIALVSKYAICIADSREINSALIYIHPNAKEPGLFDYLKAGGLKILFELGPKMIIKLLRFDAQAKRVSTKYQSTTKDGYLLGFATRIDKQHHHLGTPLIESLSKYLDASGEGCYLETFKRENVGLYEHFGFNLMEECNVSNGKLKLFAMHREPASHKKCK